MTKLEKVAISHNFNLRVVVFFVPVQEQFAENTNKSYHVCRVIVVLHIYHKMFGIAQKYSPDVDLEKFMHD